MRILEVQTAERNVITGVWFLSQPDQLLPLRLNVGHFLQPSTHISHSCALLPDRHQISTTL
eukprot:3482540-Rhodomonas_salina.2